MKKVLLTMLVLVFGMTFATAHAQEMMDAHQADKTTTKIRKVSYQCATGGKILVKYGFNRQKQPTYAEAHLGGKSRFLPINLAQSDVAGTFFGDENSWQIGTDALTLNNYQRTDVLIQDPDAKIIYKTCKVVSHQRVKG